VDRPEARNGLEMDTPNEIAHFIQVRGDMMTAGDVKAHIKGECSV
jgi:hypothetical protein